MASFSGFDACWRWKQRHFFIRFCGIKFINNTEFLTKEVFFDALSSSHIVYYFPPVNNLLFFFLLIAKDFINFVLSLAVYARTDVRIFGND